MNLSRLVPALPLLAVLSFPALATASEDDSAAIKKAEAAMDMVGKTSLTQVPVGLALGGQGFGFTPFGEKKK